MLSKALQRSDKMLEIDQVLRIQMQVKVALKQIFNSSERFLLRNNQAFVLNSSSSSAENSSESDIN